MPHRAQQKLQEGQRFFFSKPPDVSRAVSAFEEVTRLAPHWAEGFHRLASAQLQQSKLAEAEASYHQAIALAPTDPRPHLALGTVFERAGRLDESVRSLRAGLALKPHYCEADSRMTLASVLKRLGRTDEAVREWQTVAKMEAMYPSYDEPIQAAKKELKSLGKTTKS